MDCGDILPTPERARRGVALVPEAIADEHGRPSQPYVATDILGKLWNRGAITAEMLQAGVDFRTQFRAAMLDPLAAADLSRPIVSGRQPQAPGHTIEYARESVWQAVTAAGGLRSNAGSCLWMVIGWEKPLKDWAVERSFAGFRISRHAAVGVLIVALERLAKFYEKTG